MKTPTPLVLLVVLPAVLWEAAEAAGAASPYTVPEPYIQALKPKGLRFSIPDEPGIELFAVHANINKPMGDLEAGEISQDVLTPKDGRWVYEDKSKRLRPGDEVTYWLYVKREGLGYRKEKSTHTVTELVDQKTSATPPAYGSSQSFSQGCRDGPDAGELNRRLLEQRLRHQQELHEQRLRHQEELHKARLQQLQHGRPPNTEEGADGEGDAKGGTAEPGADPQDVWAHRRIGQ